ncbi:MAG: hypothetical protein M3R46_12090, partial [Actinomycetota bacterium]|nr:hypothetical protein [Actinomycetota bacterium]
MIAATSTLNTAMRSSVSTVGNRVGFINSGVRTGAGPRTRARSRNASEITNWRPGRASGRRSF